MIGRKESNKTNKGTVQPAHPRSLISPFVIRYLKSQVTRSDHVYLISPLFLGGLQHDRAPIWSGCTHDNPASCDICTQGHTQLRYARGFIMSQGLGIYIYTHFYCLAVEAGFYSDVVECLPMDPETWVRFPNIFALGQWPSPQITHPMTVLCINISLGLISRDSCTKKFRDEFQIGGGVCPRV